MYLVHALSVLADHGDLVQFITVNQLQLFLELASHLRTRISWSQPPVVSTPPTTLPASVFGFLCAAIDVPPAVVKLLWAALQFHVWESPSKEARPELYAHFLKYGREFNIGYRDLYPPTRTCLSCKRGDGRAGVELPFELGDERSYEAVLFSHDLGAIPVYAISLYCHRCNTRYHHNFFVHDGATMRTYYGGIPPIIQISRKFFATAQLCEHFCNEMMCAWVSGLNNARIYNLTHPIPTVDWSVGFEMVHDHVWDAFFLHSLLIQAHEDGKLLQLEHRANSHADRLRPALDDRTEKFSGPGREMWNHACNGCCKEVEDEDGSTGVLL